MASRDYALSKLYVGNMPIEATEKMFAEYLGSCKDLDMNRVVKLTVKKGYGFIECMDQVTSDIIIDKFHSAPFCGAVLSIEPAVPNNQPGGNRTSLTRVVFSTAETQGITEDDVQDIISKWGGQVTAIHPRADVTGIHGGSVAYIVTLEKGQDGDDLVSKFNGFTTKSGVKVKAKVVGRARSDRDGDPRTASRSRSFTKAVGKNTEFPLRILVPADMVGAIIGKGGATIKELTTACDARVDILKAQLPRHFNGSDKAEKIITILGAPDNCTEACRKILEILVADANNTRPNSEVDMSLRILASNSLIGRVIGKAGTNIRKIMQDTQTKIQVSNQTEYQTTFWQGFRDSDRIITIRGSIDGMTKAESMVTAKLRTAFEADYQSKLDRGVVRVLDNRGVFPAIQDDLFLAPRPPNYEWLAPTDLPHNLKSEITTTYVYVPPQTVGCLIGAKGSTIREMNRASGAIIKIEKVMDENSSEDAQQCDRRVTIVGPADSHMRAQWLIFERLRSSGLIQSAGELKFTVEMIIPSRYVGRLIGKAGSRIQELQQQTLTTIKFVPYTTTNASAPADIVASHSGAGDASGPNSNNCTLARIHGTAFHVLSAESKLRNFIYEFILRAEKMESAAGAGSFQPGAPTVGSYYMGLPPLAPRMGGGPLGVGVVGVGTI